MSDRLVSARVESIIALTDTILQVILLPDHYVDYQAGQYLQILAANEELSYSIANAPLGSRKYELHIRHNQDNASNQHLLAEIKQHAVLTLRLPLGHCHLNKLEIERSILFIAGGTGFAPIKAMIEQLLATGDKRPFELFWGARSRSDLYLDDKVVQWQAHVQRFRYFSLMSSNNKETLINKVLEHHPDDLANWQVVIGGPFDMAYAIRDFLVTAGLSRTQLFADAFSFEEKES